MDKSRELTSDDIAKRLDGFLPNLQELDARVKFDFGDQGYLIVDATQNPVCLDDSDSDIDCTVLITPDNLLALVDGKLNAMLAYTTGKIKINGSMGLAMKLNMLLEDL